MHLIKFPSAKVMCDSVRLRVKVIFKMRCTLPGTSQPSIDILVLWLRELVPIISSYSTKTDTYSSHSYMVIDSEERFPAAANMEAAKK